MAILLTMGYQGLPLCEFIQRLQTAGADAVIDVRLRNTSQLCGYTKRDDLAFLLRRGFGIAYEHRPELSPTQELLDLSRQQGDWGIYEAGFRELMVERGMAEIGATILSKYATPCLICLESDPAHCHRRLLAELWAASMPGLLVVHL